MTTTGVVVVERAVLDRAVDVPDPVTVRMGTVEELRRLGVRVPPPQYPLVWDPGDTVRLRRRGDLAARAAILGVLLATHDGLPRRQAMRWLRDARLLERVTPREWRFIAGGVGDAALIDLERDALHGLAWLLGLVDDLDPRLPRSPYLAGLLPDPRTPGEEYPAWRATVPRDGRDPVEAAVLLDLYYCLDWAYQEADRRREDPPGAVPPVAIGARRWALEWAVVLTGRYHEDPAGWEDVDLSV